MRIIGRVPTPIRITKKQKEERKDSMFAKKSAMVSKILAFALSAAMLCGIRAFATEVYDSQIVSDGIGDNWYDTYSSVYVGAKSKAATWIQTSSTEKVPEWYIGGIARLYNKDRTLIKSTGMRYNSKPSNFYYAVTEYHSNSEPVYSQGQVDIYTGTEYLRCDVASANSFSDSVIPSHPPTHDDIKHTPTNATGKTYGSSLFAGEPDMIAAIGTDGVHGYVRADDLDPKVSNPEEAEAYMATFNENRILPLYDVNETVIGTFILDEITDDDLLVEENIETVRASVLREPEETEQAMIDSDSLKDADLETLLKKMPKLLEQSNQAEREEYLEWVKAKVAGVSDPAHRVVHKPSPEEADRIEQEHLNNLMKHLVDGDYPRNSKGETYGPDGLSAIVGYEPDLISVIATNNKKGYVRAEDLNGQEIHTPEEAGEYMRNCPRSYDIPVYDLEGQVIGAFRISAGSGC